MIDTISMNAILYATCDMTDSLSFETLSLMLEHTGGLTDLKFNFTVRPTSSGVDNLRYSSPLIYLFRLPRTCQPGIALILPSRLSLLVIGTTYNSDHCILRMRHQSLHFDSPK